MALSLADLRDKQVSEADWIVPGLLTRKNTAFMMGRPKRACKSWLMLDMGWDLAEGKAVWNIPQFKPTRPMRTVYFTQEDSEDNIHARVRAHLDAQRGVNDRLWIVPKNLNIKLDTSQGQNIAQMELDSVVERVAPDHEGHKGVIDLVIFDPMRRIHNGNENDSETIARIWTVLDRIHERYDCATFITHHTVKPPKTADSEFDPTDPYVGRGSGDIYGGGDAFVMVVPGTLAEDGSSRRLGVYFESKRDQQITPVQLRVEFKTGQVTRMEGTVGGVEKVKMDNVIRRINI